MAVHVPARSDPTDYFGTFAALTGEVGGRPHWGKEHDLDAAVLAQRRLGHVEIAEDIGPEGALQLLRRNFQRRLDRVLLGGVVNKDIDAPEGRHRLVDDALAKALLADVAGEPDRLSALGLDQPLPVQYLKFVERAVHGNFGVSTKVLPGADAFQV